MRIWISWKNTAPFLVSGSGAAFNHQLYIFKQAGEEKTPLLHLDIVDGMVGMNISLNRLGWRPDSHAASVALDLDI